MRRDGGCPRSLRARRAARGSRGSRPIGSASGRSGVPCRTADPAGGSRPKACRRPGCGTSGPKGKPGDDQVLVVAGVPEQGPRLRVPREVVLAGLVVANQKMDAVLIVQERLVVRSAAVDGVEVEPRGAE